MGTSVEELKERIGITHWDDIGYSVIAEFSPGYRDTCVYFRVYEITGLQVQLGSGEQYPRGWGLNCSFVGDDPESADAPVFMSGSVKWDGCSDWRFDEQDTGVMPMHFCEKESAMNIGVLFQRLYEWAKDLGMDRDW